MSTAEKLELKNAEGDLKLFIFTVQGGPTMIEVHEDVKAVMAYGDTGAVDMVRKDYPAGTVLTARKRASIEIQQILDKVNVPVERILALPPPRIEPPPPKEKTEQEWVWAMLYIAERFVKEPADQEVLRNIIGKIRYGVPER